MNRHCRLIFHFRISRQSNYEYDDDNHDVHDSRYDNVTVHRDHRCCPAHQFARAATVFDSAIAFVFERYVNGKLLLLLKTVTIKYKCYYDIVLICYENIILKITTFFYNNIAVLNLKVI